MAMKPKPPMGKTKGQKAESKRMTAMGVSEAKARLKVIDELRKMNPGTGIKIPRKQEKELMTFLKEYNKPKPRKKGQEPKATKPKPQAPKAQPPTKKNGVTPLKPLFSPSMGKAAKANKKK